MEVIIDIRQYELPDTHPTKNDWVTTRKLIEQTLQIISCWAFCPAAVFDGIDDQISGIALVVFIIALGGEYGFQAYDFYVEQKAASAIEDRVVKSILQDDPEKVGVTDTGSL